MVSSYKYMRVVAASDELFVSKVSRFLYMLGISEVLGLYAFADL